MTPKITFCTVCMNRLHHLQKTLPQNIEDNKDIKEIDFLVLDYNSNDNLEKWIKSEMSSYLANGKLKYFKTTDPKVFNRSHSRNVMFKLASGKIICNIDADNFMGKGFARYVLYKFSPSYDTLLLPDLEGEFYSHQDALGRFCCLKEDFLSVSGYDEKMSGYGYEDEDLYTRLKTIRNDFHVISELRFLKALKHNNEERTKNEYFSKYFDKLLIQYIDHKTSEMIIICTDHQYFRGQVRKPLKDELPPVILVNHHWDIGSYQFKEKELHLLKNDNTIEILKNTNTNQYSVDNKYFYHIEGHEVLNNIHYKLSLITNFGIFSFNKEKQETINPEGFGKGKIYQYKPNQQDLIIQL